MWGTREPLDTEIQKDTKNTIEIHQRHVSSIQPSIKSLLASTLFLVVVIFTGSIVYGQDETDSSDKWEVRLMPYVFFLSLDTEGTINGLSGDVDLSFDDIVDNLDFGAMGRVEAWKGKWGLFFDGLFFNLGADQDFRGRRGLVDFSVDADVRLGWAYSGLMYRLFEKPFGKNNEQRLVLRLMADLDMFTSERGLIWMSTLLV